MNTSFVLDDSLAANTNLTEQYSDDLLLSRRAIITTLDALAFFINYGTMFSMGCSLTWRQVKEVVNCRKYVAFGLSGQYLLMPLCGYLAIKIFNIPSIYAAGVTIITCSPGGGYSNVLTYLIEGEVWLSVILTLLSTSISFGVMPLNLWIYSGESLSVPYLQMTIALVLINVFLVLGMIVKWKAPTIAVYITKGGVILTSGASGFWLSFWIYLNQKFFGHPCLLQLCGAVCFVLITSPVIVGLLAYMMRCPVGVIKTLVVETPYQSIGTALTVTIISYPTEVALRVQGYIFLYNIITHILCIGPAATYQLLKFLWKCREVEEKEPSELTFPIDKTSCV